MKETRLIRSNTTLALLPVGDEAEALIKKMPMDKVMEVKYSFPRNPGNHRRFFAFINTTFDMQDHFDNEEVFRKWLTMRAGYFIACIVPNGNTVLLPESISFDNMDEVTFCECFARCIDKFLDFMYEQREMTRNEVFQVIDFI